MLEWPVEEGPVPDCACRFRRVRILSVRCFAAHWRIKIVLVRNERLRFLTIKVPYTRGTPQQLRVQSS